jgi:hypothetical protein
MLQVLLGLHFHSLSILLAKNKNMTDALLTARLMFNPSIQNVLEGTDRRRNKGTGGRKKGWVKDLIVISRQRPLLLSHPTITALSFSFLHPTPYPLPSAFQSNFVVILRTLTFLNALPPPLPYTFISPSLSVFDWFQSSNLLIQALHWYAHAA